MTLDMHQEIDRQRRLRGEEKRPARSTGRKDVPASAGGTIAVVVLREIHAAAGVMKVQRIRYADSPPVVGSYETYGDMFQAYPLTTAVYSNYEIWVWPEVDADGNPNPISVATVPLLAINERGYWLVTVPFKALASLLPPDEEASACSFG